MPHTAPAPIYSFFPGLDKLINGADFIVVADIIKGPALEERDMRGGGTFDIEVVQVLKGDIKPSKRATAYLRDLPFVIGPHDRAAPTVGLMPGGRYLLFLSKPGTHMNLDGQPPPADYENENCEGDAVWLGSPESASHYFDLESLKGKSVRESVAALLKHIAIAQQEFAKAVNLMLESRAADRLTQRITQRVLLEKNAEEASKFYMSIFKDSIFKRSNEIPKIRNYSDIGPDGKSTLTGVTLSIDGQDIVLLNGGAKFKPTEATALTLNCDVQEEIDYYWDKLSAGGEKSRGGWLRDKFGVWWHIVPSDLQFRLEDNPQSVRKAMTEMEKIDSAALWRAAEYGDTQPK
jgi:predicted 3-demethylubiquinone-9 3-methyltransferase (glyoxalase superfamily)